MPKYTDDQINEAIQKAAAKNTPGPVYAWELSMYKKVIDALPEPQDDWQACEFSDIRKGDRIKLVTTSRFSLTVKTLEATAKHKDRGAWLDEDSETIVCFPANGTQEKLYRIPAPVTHPDPAEHPVIIVHLHNGVKETKRAFVWNGESYGCLDGPHSFLAPHQITDWEPAKVVADND